MKRKVNLLIILASVLIIISYYAYSYISFKVKDGRFGLGNPDQSYTHHNKANGYSILLPGGWHVHEVVNPPEELNYHSETMSPGNIKTIGEVSTILEASVTYADLLDYSQISKHALTLFDEISSQRIKVGNNDGLLTEFTFLGKLLITRYFYYHCYEWITIGNNGYVFTYCVDDDLWDYGEPIIYKMLESIQLE